MDNIEKIRVYNKKIEEVCKLAIENNEELVKITHRSNECSVLCIMTVEGSLILNIKNSPVSNIETTYEYFPLYFEWKNKKEKEERERCTNLL